MAGPTAIDVRAEANADLAISPEDTEEQPWVPALPWRRIVLQALGMWLATRAALGIVSYISVVFLTNGFDPAKMGVQGPFPPVVVLRYWLRWDTSWYIRISTEGYPGDLSRAAFFPLYPFLIDLFSFGGGEDVRLGVALLIANLAALAAFIAIGLLAYQELGETAATLSIIALSAHPFAFFMAAAYPESLLISFATFSILFARRGMWYWAALFAFLAALTRPVGIVLALPLAWEYAQAHGWLPLSWGANSAQRLRPSLLLKGILVVAAAPLAFGAYNLYLWVISGEPWAFFQAQSTWGHRFVPPWDLPLLLVSSVLNQPAWSFGQARLLIDVLAILLFVVLTVLSVRRLPVSFTLYIAAVLYISVASPIVGSFDPFTSAARYLLAAVPAFLLLGLWMVHKPWLNILVVACGFMLQSLFMAFFLMGGWIV